jgi:hypothetical protein
VDSHFQHDPARCLDDQAPSQASLAFPQWRLDN